MQKGYFAAAWGDIRETKGWFGKFCLLALVLMIPIFGFIVVGGYLWGWARDIAWNIKKPMPARIFGNEDGKLYRRGWFIFLVGLVIALVIGVVQALINGAFSAAMPAAVQGARSAARGTTIVIASGGAGTVASLIALVLQLVAVAFTWVGSMRSAIYDNISSGLQIGKIWAMLRHDFGGIARIFGMTIIFSVVFGVIVAIVVMLFSFILIAMGAASLAPFMGSSMTGMHSLTGAQAAQAASALVPTIVLGTIFALALVYFCLVFMVFLDALTYRALGYWTRNFDVAHWGSQKDPMPFEIAEAATAQQATPATASGQPAAAPVQPVSAEPVAPAQPAAPVASAQPAPPAEPASVASEPAAPTGEPVIPAATQTPEAPAADKPSE